MKRKLTTTVVLALIFSLITVFSLRAQEVYYMFNNSLADSSGNANNGVDSNMAYTADIAGLPNHAALLNGTNAFVTVPSGWTTGLNEIATSLWFKTSNHKKPFGLAYAGGEAVHTSPANYTPLMWVDSVGKLCGYFYDGSVAVMESADTVNDNQWHHAVMDVRVNPGNGQVWEFLWLDGKMVSTKTGGTTNGSNLFTYLYVGTCNPRGMGNVIVMPDVWEFMEGSIDNVIFSGAPMYTQWDLLITEHPQSQTKNVGQPVTMHISNTWFHPDSAYTYQWYKNGGLLVGETDSVLSIAAAALADAGSYKCRVMTWDSFKVYSEPATLTVNTVGVKEIAKAGGIQLSPNPASDVLNISLNAEATAEVYNVEGRLMLAQKLNADHSQINISALAPGMYMLQLHTGTERSIEKFIKK